MANMQVTVVDGNNVTVSLDRGVAGVGIASVELVVIDSANYLLITYTNGETQTVGPVGVIQYNATSPINIAGSTISLTTVPVNLGGTGQTTANAGLNALLPAQTGQANKYLQTDGTNSSWDAISLSTADITGVLPVVNGGTGVATSTGTGSTVLSSSPTLVTPILGTPTSGTLTNATGLPVATGISGLGTGVATFLATPSSANLAAALTDETGTGAAVFATSPILTTPVIGQINDANGNEVLSLVPVTSATDYVAIQNGIGVGSPLHIYADGSSANTGMHIQPKGTGLVTISDGLDFNKGIRFRSSGSAASAVTLLDAVATAGRVVTLPDATTTLVGRDTTDTLTNKSISGTGNTLTNIGNSSLVNSTISGVALGSNLFTLTIGTGLTGTSYNGSAAVTVAIDSTVVTLTGTQTLTNKSISGSTNTLSNIGNSSLTNSSVTVGTTAISLGGTSLTLGGLTSVAVTQDPATALQLATKQYVDNVAAKGLTYHEPVQAATTASLASTTGGTVTYNAPGPEGVGATITLSVALTVLDGYTLANTNRILVKNEVNQAYNGIYTWATGGTVLTRSTDANTYGSDVNQLSQNDYFFVQNGTVNKGSSYVVTTVGVINFTTTPITFSEFSNSQTYSATSPIVITGTTISLTTVPVNLGGTNITSYTAGDTLYASGATTLSKLALGTQGYVLTAGATGPVWSGISGGTF